MFITFEGIDGCGKTTQLRKLKEYLESVGYDVVALREPGGTVLSEKIREFLLYSDDSIAARAELMLFEAARAQLIESIIKPALNSNKIVISDRFYDSTTAYQGYGRGLAIEQIIKCNLFATDNIKPDITFFLDVSLEESKSRSHNRYQDRIEKAGDLFFERVIEGFKNIAIDEPDRFIIIDAKGSAEETSELILEQIKQRLQPK